MLHVTHAGLSLTFLFFLLCCAGNYYFHNHDLGKKTGLISLSIKRIWKVIYTYWGVVSYNFVWFFISATRVHPPSYLRNGCHLSSEIWNGQNCCLCSIHSSADWTSCWSSCCPCSLPHKRTSLPGTWNNFNSWKMSNDGGLPSPKWLFACAYISNIGICHIYNIVFLFPNIPLCFFSLKFLQICHEFERFSTYLPDIRVAVFYGGVNVKTHKDLLKNECPHIVVGTPGRILALGRDKDLGLKNVRHFILDECDKMLESLGMAFIFFFLLPLGSEIRIFAIVLFSFQCLLCC